MKVKGYADVFASGKINVKKGASVFIKFLIGVFACSVKIFGGYPFAYSVTALGSLPAFLGAVFCSVVTGDDSIRMVTALFSVFMIKKFIMPKFSFPAYAKVFIPSLWGVLLSEVLGALIFNYTFTENFLFALSGVIGALSAIAFEYGNSEENKNRGTNIYFVSVIFSVSVVFCGMASSGRLLSDTAIILAIFTILCLSVKASLFCTVSFASVIGGCMCVMNGKSPYLMAVFIIGGMISSLLSECGKFAVPFGFLIADVSFLIYTGFGEDSVFLTVYSLFSSVLFIILRDGQKDKFISFFLPIFPKNERKKYRIKRSKAFPEDVSEAENLCEKCSKRLHCWSENYTTVKDSFGKIAAGKYAAVSDGFWNSCIRRDELKTLCGAFSENEDCFYIELAKVSSAKMGEKLCGDSVGSFSTENGRDIVYIIDGMGTGSEASEQSRKGVNIIKKLTDNGVEERDALKVLNDFLAKGQSEIIMGIDLASIDKKTGIAEFYKAGAAPTYIIRRGSFYQIGTASLPIGILDEVNIEYNKCKLMKGDVIIMISDGFMSLGSAIFEDNLFGMKITEKDSSADISSKIMNAAEQLGLLLKDDITVVSMRVH